jgi:superfamily II DNA/RNA helicase
VQTIADQPDGNAKIFWVLPLVEDSISKGKSHIGAVITRHKMLSDMLGKHRVGLLHGRLSAVDKNAILAKFADTSTADSMNILVATSIIESGIDIPQATVCVIENAEQFGLSQLHQIRGRVGRARTVNTSISESHDTLTTITDVQDEQDEQQEQQHQCHCVLLYDEKAGNDALQRLSIMKQTKDGFEIAEADLKIRGPGELLGYRQKGYLTSSLRVTDLIVHAPLVPIAHDHARKLVSKCLELSKKSFAWKTSNSNDLTDTGLGLKLLSALFDFGWDLTFEDLNDVGRGSSSNTAAASKKSRKSSTSSTSSKVKTRSVNGYIGTDDAVDDDMLQQPPLNPLAMRNSHTKTTTPTVYSKPNVNIEYIELHADGTATTNNISEAQPARSIAMYEATQQTDNDNNSSGDSNTDVTSDTTNTIYDTRDTAVRDSQSITDSDHSEDTRKQPIRLTVTTLSTEPLMQIDTPQYDMKPLDDSTMQRFADSWPDEFDDKPWTTTTATEEQTADVDNEAAKRLEATTASASSYKSMSLELSTPDNVFKLRQNVYSNNDYGSNSFVRTRRTAADATTSVNSNYKPIDLTVNSDDYIFIVVDVETTGLTTAGNCMLQMAAMVLGSSDGNSDSDDRSSATSFNAYCNPDAVISRHISVNITLSLLIS